MKTLIVIPDFTRKARLKRTLPYVLKKLAGQGTLRKDIEVIIATGLHRAPTKKEIKKNLGRIANQIKISVHDYRSVIYFGKTRKGMPVYLNKKIKNADSIITIGVVEPHLYAGYSGGVKAVSIGLAGEKTINSTHHPRFLDHPKTKICSIQNNIFREFIDEVSTSVPVEYSLNIINGKIIWDSPGKSFKKAVRIAGKIFEKKINKKFDIIISDVPEEKGINIYQASRAFNYILNTKKCALKKHGLVLVKSGLKEGFGKGIGEKRFKRKIIGMKNPAELIRDVKKRGCLAGEHRAYMVAKAMKKARLGFISKRAYLYKNNSFPFLFFRNIKEANNFINIKRDFKKKVEIYYLKNPFKTILVKN